MMDKTEVFIMVSDNETFGLVYLEAMSRGCIVIASKNGGMDGIIKNGVNGFLCEQGNENELYKILKKIKGMSIEEKKSISENGIKTSSNFKDSHVAQNYLENVVDKV
jgi:glycogen synthase